MSLVVRFRRTAALLGGLLIIGLLAQVSTASAAQIDLTGAVKPSSHQAERCANEVTSTTVTARSSTAVTVSGIPAECAGLPVTARVYSGATAQPSAPVAVPSDGGSVNLTVPAFSPTTAHRTYVTIGGWPVPSTWDFNPWSCVVVNAQNQPVSGRTCTVTEISAVTDSHPGWTGWFPGSFALFTIETNHDAGPNQYVRIVADLATADGLPAGWFGSAARPATDSWSGGQGRLTTDTAMSCSELSWFRGRSAQTSPGQTFQQRVRANRSALAWLFEGTSATCAG